MSGRILGLFGLMGVMAIAGMGCQQMVPKTDLDTATTERNQAMAKNQTLQNDLDAARRDKEEIQRKLDEMNAKLGEGATGVMVGGRPAIRMDAAALYAPGKAELSEHGKDALNRAAAQLKKVYGDCEYRVEGHTDTDPINKTKDKYDTNWDLGAKRANLVVVYLTEKCGISPKQIYSASYGPNRPISSNKASNRRVDIVILPPMTPGSSVPASSMTGAPEEK